MCLLYCYYAFIDYYIVILTTKLPNCQTSRNKISGAQLSGAQFSGAQLSGAQKKIPTHKNSLKTTLMMSKFEVL